MNQEFFYLLYDKLKLTRTNISKMLNQIKKSVCFIYMYILVRETELETKEHRVCKLYLENVSSAK